MPLKCFVTNALTGSKYVCSDHISAIPEDLLLQCKRVYFTLNEQYGRNNINC